MPNDETTGGKARSPRRTNAAPSRPVVRALLVLFLIVAAGEFVWRGPVRSMSSSNDIKALYLGARAWWDGSDAYGEGNLRRLWREAGGAADSDVSSHLPVSVYPPPSHLVMAPLALMPWLWFKIFWMLANVVLYAGVILALARLAGFENERNRFLLFVALALALAPAHTAIAVGQVSIFCLALVVASEIWSRDQGRAVLAGAALALAVALKPHVAGPFIIYHLLCRRWKVGVTAMVLTGVITVLSLVRLSAAGVEWLDPLLENLALLRREGGVNDPTTTGQLSYQLINLHYLLYCFTDSRAMVMAVATFLLLGTGAVGAWNIARFRETGTKRVTDLVGLSFWSILMLLAAYHRFYDAVFLIIPLAWALVEVTKKDHPRLAPAIVLGAILINLVPGASVLAHAVTQGWIPPALSDTWVWRTLIMPHQVWALLLVLTVLLTRLVRPSAN